MLQTLFQSRCRSSQLRAEDRSNFPPPLAGGQIVIHKAKFFWLKHFRIKYSKKIVYSYSKDLEDLKPWQDSNVFYNLEAGDYTFYVKYADSDCYGDSIKGKIFNLKNAFSPNGDGINDYWELTGLDVFSNNSTLQIFDRYGNMVYKEVSNTEFRWDGKSNSRVLNSDTYWFVITAGDERIYKGWIYLKNKK